MPMTASNAADVLYNQIVQAISLYFDDTARNQPQALRLFAQIKIGIQNGMVIIAANLPITPGE